MVCNSQTPRVDLHVHSTASDGTLNPKELLALARRLHIAALSITDHDTIEGCKQALASGIPADIEFISGVEISAAWPPSFPGAGSLHILGYGFSLDDSELGSALLGLQESRRNRNPRILQRLRQMGINVSLNRIQEQNAGADQIGRPHIAAALVDMGVVKSIDEAFERYLGTGKPAYVEKVRIPCKDALRLIQAAGGVASLAHPGLLGLTPESVEALAAELQAMGCAGIEALYSRHTEEQTHQYKAIARRRGLIVTGGTDFHGAITSDIQLGFGTGDFFVSYAIYEALKSHLFQSRKQIPS